MPPDETLQQLLAGYLLNAVWQVPVVAVCALAISRFAGLSAQAKNGVWLGFLGLAAVLPAVSLAALLPPATPTVALAPASAGEPLAASAPAVVHPAPALAPAMALPSWSVWIMVALVALVATVLVVRLAVAAAAARRLVRASEPAELPREAVQAVERLARAYDRIPPPIRRSAGIGSPAVVGAVRPVILIPDGLAAAPGDLTAALLHEMAHVVRRDYAVNLACEVLSLPVAWHPALAGLKAGVSRSRELACDAMAAGAMASPKTYARCLVSLAQSLSAPAAPAQAAMAVGLFGRSDLEDRLMHLMTPRETEPKAVRAARLCGLAAVGASLMASAALLHVTPVFAQPVRPVAAAPLAGASPAAPVTPATAAEAQARADAGPAPAPTPRAHRHHSGMIVSRDGVIIDSFDGGYRHSFTASDGHQMTVYNDDPKEPTIDQQRQWEDAERRAQAAADKAEKMINSPEFKARIANAQARAAEAEKRVNSPEFKARIAAAQARAAEAEARVNSPEFKARIADAEKRAVEAEKMVNSPEFKARIADAQKRAVEAEKMVNSPEFKARIAEAQKRAAEAEARVNSPEFKARIAAAQARAAEAEARVNSPEFKARIAEAQKRAEETSRRMQALAERLQKQWDEEDRAGARTAP